MQEILKDIRREIIKLAHLSKGPHVGSALSCADIVGTLYFKVMNIKKPLNDDRDYFLLSKAHAAMALYATLYKKGFMDEKTVYSYYQNGGSLPAHTDRFTSEFVEISAGSLGHGLPIGLGMAHSLKLKSLCANPRETLCSSGSEGVSSGAPTVGNCVEKVVCEEALNIQKVFILMGDGEMQEGSVWEAAMLAPKLGLDNLIVFIDHNNLQGYGRATELVEFYPIEDKWRAFGWEAVTIDGHDSEAIEKEAKNGSQKPKVIICNTTKGKGVSFMEDELKWHYFLVQDEHQEQALKELV